MVVGKQSCAKSWPQIEREVLRFADPNKQAVLSIALKHFDSF
jgi:hypothetical protein